MGFSWLLKKYFFGPRAGRASKYGAVEDYCLILELERAIFCNFPKKKKTRVFKFLR